MRNFDAIVLGGGVGGLSAARRLAAAGARTALLERSPAWGGLARSFRGGGSEIEVFYHHYFTHDAHVLSLIRDVGLADRLVFRRVRQAVFLGGRLYPFTTPLDLLRFRPLPFVQRLRLGTVAIGRAAADLEGVSVEEWIGRRVGREAYDRLFAPLVLSKFGAPGAEISAAFARGRMRARGASRSRTGWTERLGYLDGGTAALAERLLAELRGRGVALVSGCRIDAIVRGAGGFSISGLADGAAETFRAPVVVSTIPTDALAGALRGIPESVREGLAGIPYRAVAVACLGLRRSLSPYYWTSVADPDAPFHALIEHTRLHGPERYGGSHVVYLGRYLDPGDAHWSLSDDALLARMIDGLRTIHPRLDPADVLWSAIARDRYASPIFGVGFDRRVSALLDAVPGLLIGGTVRVYPDSRNVNSAVRIGEELAGRALRAA